MPLQGKTVSCAIGIGRSAVLVYPRKSGARHAFQRRTQEARAPEDARALEDRQPCL